MKYTILYLNNQITETLAHQYKGRHPKIVYRTIYSFICAVGYPWTDTIQDFIDAIQVKLNIDTDTTKVITEKELQRYITAFMWEIRLKYKLTPIPDSFRGW